MKQKLALNIAAGKMLPIDFNYFHLINLDTMYYSGTKASTIEDLLKTQPSHATKYYCKEDAFSIYGKDKIIL